MRLTNEMNSVKSTHIHLCYLSVVWFREVPCWDNNSLWTDQRISCLCWKPKDLTTFKGTQNWKADCASWIQPVWYDIYLLTASGLPPGGSCTIHIYTQTTHRTTQNKQYIVHHKIWEQYKNFGRVRAVPRLGELYPGIGLTTEENARKNLSQGSI
jgi:hypothetical protein